MKRPSPTCSTESPVIASSGVHGLDDVLAGGFTRGRLYLVDGVPGSGKTTLAFQFLMDGARLNEPVLYVTLSECEDEIQAMAASHGWNIQGITIREVIPSEGTLNSDDQYTMFYPSEIELSETAKSNLADVERIKPRRIVFDSRAELRLLAGSPLRYRRQILALKQFFAKQKCTVLLLDDLTATDRDLQVQSISHGVVLLEQVNPEYGTDRRRLRFVKYRGHTFRGGYHNYLIQRGGIHVYPRFAAAEHRREILRDKLKSGIPALDASQPVPGEHALGANNQVITEALDGAQEIARLGPHVAM